MNIQAIKNISMVNNYKFLNKKPEKKENLNSFDNSVSSKCASNYAISFLRKYKPIYSIDRDGNLTMFSSTTEACEKLNCSLTSIYNVLSKTKDAFSGYKFVYTDEITKKDENGKLVLDYKKIEEIVDSTDFDCGNKPVYAIDKKGNFTRFDSAKKASEELDCSYDGIRRVLFKKIKVSSGYVFVYADKVETRDEKGKLVLDDKKVKQVMQGINFNKNAKAIYAIDKKGNLRRFDSIREATKELNCSTVSIQFVLNKKRDNFSGYKFVYASDIETKDKEGNIVLDDKKIREIIENTNFNHGRKAVYAIDTKGNFTRFDSAKKASEELDCLNYWDIYHALARHTHQNFYSGYTFVYADEVETKDKEGNLVLDDKKIREIIENTNFADKKAKTIYVVDKEGNVKKFDSVIEASKKLYYSATSIYYFLNKTHKSAVGYRFFLANEIEKEYEENGLENIQDEAKRLIIQKFYESKEND